MSSHYQRAAIGIGSNLCRPRLQVRQALRAIARLPGTRIARRSSVYRSAPLGSAMQPAYLNAAIVVRTRLDAFSLLSHLHDIEQRQGRTRRRRWGARTLDLDLLLYDRLEVQSARLNVPHPEMVKRDFVLYPLAEIAAEWPLPDGRMVSSLARSLPGNSVRRISY